jgi:hypothetical protein
MTESTDPNRSILIVANETLASPTLANAVAERIAAGACEFHVVVPATPIEHRLTWDEDEANAAARERLTAVLERLHRLGVDATGEIGNRDPVTAVRDAMLGREVHEIILSTLPEARSRWLRQDVPSRLRSAVEVPVAVVTAPRELVDATTGQAQGEARP